MLRVALNGCGRVGRLVLQGVLAAEGIDLVAVNERASATSLANSLGRDTLRGAWPGTIAVEADRALVLNGRQIPLLQHDRPEQCPWGELEVDLVIEATGRFTARRDAERHLGAGAQRVLVAAPLLGDDRPDLLLVPGVNDGELTAEPRLLSLASCTTNCAAPLLDALHREWEIRSTFLSTVHAYTNDQPLLDAPHLDPRRARAAALNIVPTTTRAGDAIQQLLPWTQGRFQAVSYRVPVPGGSLVELVCSLAESPECARQVNDLLRARASEGTVIEVTDEPLVSWDVLGCRASALVDAPLTQVLDEIHVKVVAWYDNEAGYAARVVETAQAIAQLARRESPAPMVPFC